MVRMSNGPRNKAIIRGTKKLAQVARRAARRTMVDFKGRIKERSKELMEMTKSGNQYRVYVSKNGRRLKSPRLHTASERGEPFALMSGATYRSIGFSSRGWSVFVVGVGTLWGAHWERASGGAFRSVLGRVLLRISKEVDNDFGANMKRMIKQEMR